MTSGIERPYGDASIFALLRPTFRRYRRAMPRQKICVTGKYDPMTRAQVEAAIASMGHVFQKSVTADTDVLLCVDPDANTSKLKRARADGVKIVSYTSFFGGAKRSTKAAAKTKTKAATKTKGTKTKARTARKTPGERAVELVGEAGASGEGIDESHLPPANAKNLFEAMVVAAQKFLTAPLECLFANAIFGSRHGGGGDVYCPRYVPGRAEPEIWLWLHDEAFVWKRAADSFAQLDRAQALLDDSLELDPDALASELEKAGIDEDASTADRIAAVADKATQRQLSKLVAAWSDAGMAKPPEDYDFSTLISLLNVFQVRSKHDGALAISADSNPFERSRWIVATLLGVAGSARPAEDAGEGAEKALRGLPTDNVGDALYWLLWGALLGDAKQAKTLIALAEAHPVRVVRDAAATCRKLVDDDCTIGSVDLVEMRTWLRTPPPNPYPPRVEVGQVTFVRIDAAELPEQAAPIKAPKRALAKPSVPLSWPLPVEPLATHPSGDRVLVMGARVHPGKGTSFEHSRLARRADRGRREARAGARYGRERRERLLPLAGSCRHSRQLRRDGARRASRRLGRPRRGALGRTVAHVRGDASRRGAPLRQLRRACGVDRRRAVRASWRSAHRYRGDLRARRGDLRHQRGGRLPHRDPADCARQRDRVSRELVPVRRDAREWRRPSRRGEGPEVRTGPVAAK